MLETYHNIVHIHAGSLKIMILSALKIFMVRIFFDHAGANVPYMIN